MDVFKGLGKGRFDSRMVLVILKLYSLVSFTKIKFYTIAIYIMYVYKIYIWREGESYTDNSKSCPNVSNINVF